MQGDAVVTEGRSVSLFFLSPLPGRRQYTGRAATAHQLLVGLIILNRLA